MNIASMPTVLLWAATAHLVMPLGCIARDNDARFSEQLVAYECGISNAVRSGSVPDVRTDLAAMLRLATSTSAIERAWACVQMPYLGTNIYAATRELKHMAIQDPDDHVQWYALRTLKQLDERVLSDLLAVYEEARDRTVAYHALGALTQYGEKTAKVLPHLFAILDDGDPTTRGIVSGVIQAAGPDAIPGLIQRLHARHNDCRDVAQSILIAFGTNAIPAVVSELGKPDLSAKHTAMMLLRQMGTNAVSSIPAIRQYASSETQAFLKQEAERTILIIEESNGKQ